MASVALPDTAVSQRTINPWLVAAAVVIPTFMEVLDTTIANVTGDWPGSEELALESLEKLRAQQAGSLAYFDDFWLFAVLALMLVPLVLLMKRSVAEKGAHVGAE